MTSGKGKAKFNWEELGHAYQAFNLLCDSADWENILTEVARSLITSSRAHVRVLDIGAGLGLSSDRIRRKLYWSHRVTSDWDLVDPDPVARFYQRLLVPTLGDKFRVRIFKQLPRTGVYDAILLLHSTYYLRDVHLILKKCAGLCRHPDGILVIVAMQANSEFFVPALQNTCHGVAEDVERAVRKIGLKFDTAPLRSGFRWPADTADDESLAHKITQFIAGRVSVTQDEISIVRSHFSRTELDFRDRRIIIRRK